ncbi:hypothetical protein [Candidatus Uabimicrobium amorphum]|uniref:Uncharacterized protein n=1 Tax=Uabimicrobium amorphum TaxID=2596890 RepID=A0A5S9IMW4_UABAM|nr:hypothetical protein [Candidatus Uabimicrobium amorphum]BBM83485.1 hypothetical protein UABAM_01837 [Candidatus Uabimicrobium amorphum]
MLTFFDGMIPTHTRQYLEKIASFVNKATLLEQMVGVFYIYLAINLIPLPSFVIGNLIAVRLPKNWAIRFAFLSTFMFLGTLVWLIQTIIYLL